MQFSKPFALAVLLVNCGIADLDVHDDSMLFVRDVHDESMLFIQQKQSSTIETDEYEMLTADSTAASWRLGERGASCDQVCSQDGGTCTENVWPTSQNEFDAIYSTANRDADCAGSGSGGAAFNPSMHDNFFCYWKNVVSSDNCGASNSNYRRFCPCVSPAPIIQQCLSIITGSSSDDDGYLSLWVQVDGSYLSIASDRYYDHGVKVLDTCYDGEVNVVRVQNTRTNAWVGRVFFYYLIDGNSQDHHFMYCYSCSRNGVANEITVDGNSDSGDLADTHCYDGRLCYMRREITLSPTASPTPWPTRSPTSSPTRSPTSSPTRSPTRVPTSVPTSVPTLVPTSPTFVPTSVPTSSPTSSPTPSPTPPPTLPPTTQAAPAPVLSDAPHHALQLAENSLGAAGGIMRFENIMEDGTQLVMENVTEYNPFKPNVTGLTAPSSSMAQVSLGCGDKVEMVFSFLLASEPKSMDNFDFTVADLDQGTHQRCAEMVEVVGYANYSLYPSSSIRVETGATPFRFVGTADGSQADNPQDMETMTDEQKAKAVSFLVQNRETFTVLFSTTEPGVSSDDPDVVGYNGRRILFGFGTP